MKNKISKVRNIIFFTLFFSFAFLFFIYSSFALDVKRTVLDNGLTLLTVERHNLPVVKVTVGLKAGSLMEPEEISGLANITASLLTEGTQTRTSREISEAIEFVGGSVGAGGGDDYSTVSLSVLKKDVELGFDLLSDIMLHPSFPDEELSKKKERLKASLKAREEDPGFVAAKEFKKAVFGSHPYGRLVSGTEETLDAISREDIVNFHSTYYVPNSAIMAVVGDISAAEVTSLLERYFSDWHSRDVEKNGLLPLNRQRQRKTVTVDKDLTQATIKLGHLGVSRNNPDYYAVSVMNYILGGGGFASRLMLNIREEKGLVYDIHSFFSADKFGGSFQVGLKTKNESANIAIKEVLEEIKRIKTLPVSDTELSDAQSFLTGSFPMRIETSSRIARFLVAVEYYDLGVEYIDNYPAYINKISKEDIMRVAEKYLDDVEFTLVVVADQEKAALKNEWK
jgi:zinc protease